MYIGSQHLKSITISHRYYYFLGSSILKTSNLPTLFTHSFGFYRIIRPFYTMYKCSTIVYIEHNVKWRSPNRKIFQIIFVTTSVQQIHRSILPTNTNKFLLWSALQQQYHKYGFNFNITCASALFNKTGDHRFITAWTERLEVN